MEFTRQFNLRINGTAYTIDIRKADDGQAVVEVNGTKYDVVYESKKKASKTPTLVRPPAYTSSEDRPKSFSNPEDVKIKGIKSPLPGVILAVNVKEGDSVRAGQVILIMEAMKMENNIVAPNDGVIKSVKVQKGDNVLEGALLIEIGA